MLLPLYHSLTANAALPLTLLLKQRLARGKEHETRWREKKAVITKPRPPGALIWLHAASVGEAQSALILLDKISKEFPGIHILVTSGTLTSANMLTDRLPKNAFHQFAPLDHPKWVETFLDHWQPDMALWMESELWPNLLSGLKKRNVPAILLNARLSNASLDKWKLFSKTAKAVLSTFSLVLCQTEEDVRAYQSLGAAYVEMSGNLKYSAAPLPYDDDKLTELQQAISLRPLWLYASTHKGEEEIAARAHLELKKDLPGLLTIIVPRHPERGTEIEQNLNQLSLRITRRTDKYTLPADKTDIYLADTLGELGLFYRLSPVAMIGRSLSNDGGGGHNPIEAALLDCAVLHGPNVQNLQKIYNDMLDVHSSVQIDNEQELIRYLRFLLTDSNALEKAQAHAKAFCDQQDHILAVVWDRLMPYLNDLKTKDVA